MVGEAEDVGLKRAAGGLGRLGEAGWRLWAGLQVRRSKGSLISSPNTSVSFRGAHYTEEGVTNQKQLVMFC